MGKFPNSDNRKRGTLNRCYVWIKWTKTKTKTKGFYTMKRQHRIIYAILTLSCILLSTHAFAKERDILREASLDFIGKRYKQSFNKYLPYAEKGNSDAQFYIADMYEYGKGVEKNYKQAFKWHKKAAEKGNKYSQNQLALLYRKGKGTNINYTEALKWFKKSAYQGVDHAIANMAAMYEQGEGVKQNTVVAIFLYEKACNMYKKYGDSNIYACRKLQDIENTQGKIGIKY